MGPCITVTVTRKKVIKKRKDRLITKQSSRHELSVPSLAAWLTAFMSGFSG